MSKTCCTPCIDESLTLETAGKLAADFKVLSDPVRLRLLSIIAASPDGEICACDLPEPLNRSQATVSHHLSVLVRAGLITREQRGKWAWFAIAPDRSNLIRSVMELTPAKS